MADNKLGFTDGNNEESNSALNEGTNIPYNQMENISSVEGLSLNNNSQEDIVNISVSNINDVENPLAKNHEATENSIPETGKQFLEKRNEQFKNEDNVKSKVSNVLNRAFHDKNKERKIDTLSESTGTENTGKRKNFADRLEKVSNNEKGIEEIKNKNIEINVDTDTPTEIFERVDTTTINQNSIKNNKNNIENISNTIEKEENYIYVGDNEEDNNTYNENEDNIEEIIVTTQDGNESHETLDNNLERNEHDSQVDELDNEEENIEYGNSHSTYDKVLKDNNVKEADGLESIESEEDKVVDNYNEDLAEEPEDKEYSYYDDEYYEDDYYEGEEADYDDSEPYIYDDEFEDYNEEDNYLDDDYINEEEETELTDYTEERKKKVANGTYNEENEFGGRLLEDLEDLDDSENDMYKEWTKNDNNMKGETLIEVLQSINSNLESIAKALGAK